MLLIFGGLPATGKSTTSQCIAKEFQAIHIRVDSIEQALRDEGFNAVCGEGYTIAYRIAADNLALGSTVFADSVNSIGITRDAWRSVGELAGVRILEIEIVCSDQKEHKQRIETRKTSIEGLPQPTWDKVLTRDYEPWPTAKIVIDTAGETPKRSVEKTLSSIKQEPVS